MLSLAATIAAVVILLAAAWWLVNHDDPRPQWMDEVRWPELPHVRLPRRTPKTPPRAHGGTGDPCTGPCQPDETGARRLATRIHGWLYPATGQHSAAVLRLDIHGQWRDTRTGDFTIPADYGTTITAAERLWKGLP